MPKFIGTFLLICLISILSNGNFYAQYDRLIKDRENLKTQIEKTETILQKSKKDQAQGWKNAQILQKQIADRKQLLTNISKETELLEKELTQSNLEHRIQLDQLEILKKEYYLSLRKKWTNQHYNSASTILMASEDVKTLVLKYTWTEQLNRNRQKKYENFKIAQDKVLSRHQEIVKKIDEQKKLVQSRDTHVVRLERDLEEELQLAKRSETQQKEYLAQIKKYQSEMLKLEKMISQRIAELDHTESSNKGPTKDWIFPLKDGVVITRFGKQTDPKNKQIKINNNGVDIRSGHAFVTAAQDAEVVQIKEMPNGSYMVMTRHDNLYMVYSNLRQVLVRQGERLQGGNQIGQCRSSEGGQHELHFEVWKGKKPEDPVRYIGN